VDDQRLFQDIKGQASDAEGRAVEAWRQASSANEARYQALRRVLDATSRTRAVDSSPPPVLEILQIAAARANQRSRRSWVQRGLVAAAGIAAVLAVIVALQWTKSASEFGFEEMASGESQPVTVSLRDGSVMRLAPRSRARIRVRDGFREVQLTGRAFFSVAKMNGLPFVVRTQAGDVTVLGTQFDVDSRNADIRLFVIEGKVAVTAARGGETLVTRGQEVRVVDGRLQSTEVLKEPSNETRWVGHFLAFRDTPLSEVAKQIERAYDVHVTIADSTLAGHTVTDWFSDRSLEDVVRVVCAVVATECVVRGNDVIMGKSLP